MFCVNEICSRQLCTRLTLPTGHMCACLLSADVMLHVCFSSQITQKVISYPKHDFCTVRALSHFVPRLLRA
jgi:hypothetical protein